MTDPFLPLTGLALSRSAVDRAVEHREDEAWLAERWHHETTRVLRVTPGFVAVTPGPGTPRLDLLTPGEAPSGERYLLGVDDAGAAYFAVRTELVDAEAGLDPDGTSWAGLREVGASLPDADVGLAVHAVALAHWHATHTHCPRCGQPTVVVAAGSRRRCRADGSLHFPRTDPAVIVVVTDPDDRALLGRQRYWPQGRFSTLAGFVEPGEDAERAVIREVAEEAGVEVDEVRYLGSQPWPFPASLMLGFVARATSGAEPVVDGDEIAEARWFTRADLAAASSAGVVVMPPPVSIARRLIERWYGGPIPDPAVPEEFIPSGR